MRDMITRLHRNRICYLLLVALLGSSLGLLPACKQPLVKTSGVEESSRSESTDTLSAKPSEDDADIVGYLTAPNLLKVDIGKEKPTKLEIIKGAVEARLASATKITVQAALMDLNQLNRVLGAFGTVDVEDVSGMIEVNLAEPSTNWLLPSAGDKSFLLVFIPPKNRNGAVNRSVSRQAIAFSADESKGQGPVVIDAILPQTKPTSTPIPTPTANSTNQRTIYRLVRNDGIYNDFNYSFSQLEGAPAYSPLGTLQIFATPGAGLIPVYRCASLIAGHYMSVREGCEATQAERQATLGYLSTTSTAAAPLTLYRCGKFSQAQNVPNHTVWLSTTRREDCPENGFEGISTLGFVPR